MRFRLILMLSLLVGICSTVRPQAALAKAGHLRQSDLSEGQNERSLSIAIVPFRSLSSSASAPNLGSDIAGRLWTKLHTDPDLAVSDPVEVEEAIKGLGNRPARGTDPWALRVGRQLSASLVVTGSYQIVGSTIQVDAHILSTGAGRTVSGTDVSVSGSYPAGFFPLIDKLATKVSAAMNSTPARTAPTPLFRSPRLRYQQGAVRQGEPAESESQAAVVLKNLSPFGAAFQFRSADGQLYPIETVSANSVSEIKLPANKDFEVVVKSKGGDKALHCCFSTGYTNEIAYDAQVALLNFANRTTVAIRVRVTQGGGASAAFTLDPGQTETLRVPPGQYFISASADNVANQLEDTATVQVGEEKTTTYEFKQGT